MQRRWLTFFTLVAIWLFVGFVLSIEAYLNVRVNNMMRGVDYWEVAVPQYIRAAMWGCMAPLILMMRERVPLSRGNWVGGMSFHFIFSFVVMAVFFLGRIAASTIVYDEPFTGFWQIAANNFWGRNIIDMAFYWGVLAFGFSAEIYRKYRNEELRSAQLEARLIETELKALRQQMHPHFLFNTMNTISVLVREKKNDEAVTLVARLSTLLRMSLDNTGVQEVTLRQEMDFLEKYLEIQQARFSDRLRVSIMIAPEALLARIPNLLLQPIVENAILHGIAPRPSAGHVEIMGRIEGENLHLEVRDDGLGFDGSVRAKEGIGLVNTRERLSKIYGTRGQLSLRSEPGRGVSVQIVLPHRL
ncbi:MAG: signal transduction histidine kinase, LytS [Verrucomicrobia bacterium]|nr:signal transduction histidine kinase, LytS [Verrucomicrobiota bacterium]